jgi:hypothetical protein
MKNLGVVNSDVGPVAKARDLRAVSVDHVALFGSVVARWENAGIDSKAVGLYALFGGCYFQRYLQAVRQFFVHDPTPLRPVAGDSQARPGCHLVVAVPQAQRAQPCLERDLGDDPTEPLFDGALQGRVAQPSARRAQRPWP